MAGIAAGPPPGVPPPAPRPPAGGTRGDAGIPPSLDALSLADAQNAPHAGDAPDPYLVARSGDIAYEYYRSELQLPEMAALIEEDLSEPYSVYTYRYFLMQWPHLCFLAKHGDAIVGLIINRLEPHRGANRGYIGMLCVRKEFRGRGIASSLVRFSLAAFLRDGADEVVLETEVSNAAALALYERLGFVRDKRLGRYYLNGQDAFRLKRWCREPEGLN
ncbi:hypothetical protein DFJ74DRAFT_685924 [Hyaloraphidium curvatum]|nr:hypothetical protein DFJ74DRAFT_685924 [Hyaloraphidium curvatum]